MIDLFRGAGTLLLKALAAKDGAALRRKERDGRCCVARSASDRYIDPFARNPVQNGLDPSGLLFFTTFAAFWRVDEAFAFEELLLAGRPGEQ